MRAIFPTPQSPDEGAPSPALVDLLQSMFYPQASPQSIRRAIAYCKATGLDPIHKPVHIIPQWDSESHEMREVVVPGIGLYRTLAARSGCAGVSEPEFGPDIREDFGGEEICFPAWCRVTVKRRLVTGELAEFTAKELWKENVAFERGTAGPVRPNAIWAKRPYGQLAKCAEAQALRKAFPEIGAQPVAEEVEGKDFHESAPRRASALKPVVKMPHSVVLEVAESRSPLETEIVCDGARVKDRPATPGEISYLLKKLAIRRMTVQSVRATAGIADSDTLEGLTKGEFAALTKVMS